MDESDFADMVEQTPVHSYVIEYREPSVDGRAESWSVPASAISRPTASA